MENSNRPYAYAKDGITLAREVRVVCREAGHYVLHLYDYESGRDDIRAYKTERGMKAAWTRFINDTGKPKEERHYDGTWSDASLPYLGW